MIGADSLLARLLQTACRSPRSYVFLQVPVLTDATLGTVDTKLLGSQLVLTDILSVRSSKILEPGSDSCDLVLPNSDGSRSPLLSSNSQGRYSWPLVDSKAQLYIGLKDDSGGGETVVPVGVYIIQAANPDSEGGVSKITLNMLDNWNMFMGTIYAQFPPRLYGNQTSSYFNPQYQLSNPSGDLQTYVCDAVNWMTDPIQAPLYASDFTPVTVYVGTSSSPASAPTTSTYTVDYVKGIVTFSSALPADSIVSVDARPLSMAPELMLKHLFCDYGNFDPSFLKFDNSGIMLPIMENARGQSILDVAKEIALITANKGIQWQIYFDELGYLNFRELALDGSPVAVLVDQRDLLKVPAEFTTNNIHNVVRAQSRAINQQPIEVISYDVNSINNFSQKPDYDVPSQYLAGVPGMDPGSAVAFMSGITSSMLFQGSTPSIVAEVEVLYNPLYQVGDVVTIREKATGINRDFNIKQINNEFDGENVRQSLRIEELKRTQDQTFGMTYIAGSPIPQSPNPQAGQTSLISAVSIAGTQVISGGQPVLDGYFNNIIPSWDGGPLSFSVSIVNPPLGSTAYIFRWFYIQEDSYTLISGVPTLNTKNGNSVSGGSLIPSNSNSPSSATILDLTGIQNGLNWKSTEPYDFRSALDTASSRRYFWPILKCSDWSSDGVTGYTTSTTLNSTWSGGPGTSGMSSFTLYGNLRCPMTDYFGSTSSGFVGQELFAPGTPAANALGSTSSVKVGIDFGSSFSGKTVLAGIKRKNTPCTMGIFVMTTAGIFQMKKIQFMLSL